MSKMSLELHSRLIDTTILLRFAISLNQDYGTYKPFRASKTSVLQDVNSHPLEAVAAILVIKNEIVASSYISKAVSIESRSPPAGDLDVSLNDVAITTPSSKEKHYPLQTIVVRNPDSEENQQGTNLNLHHLRTIDLEDAVDLWPLIQKNRWHCAFQ